MLAWHVARSTTSGTWGASSAPLLPWLPRNGGDRTALVAGAALMGQPQGDCASKACPTAAVLCRGLLGGGQPGRLGWCFQWPR